MESAGGPFGTPGAWAPLSAPDDLFLDALPSANMLPLSQMPLPSVDEAPAQTQENAARVSLLSSQFYDAVDPDTGSTYDALDAWVEPENGHMALSPELAPIARTPLRLHSGLPTLDHYASHLRMGGSFATENAQEGPVQDTGTGFPIGSALEIVGPPGVGKTAWALQMAVSERLTHTKYGIEAAYEDVGWPSPHEACDCAILAEWFEANVEPWCAQVVLVDTEGGMPLQRVLTTVRASVAARIDSDAVTSLLEHSADRETQSAILTKCIVHSVLRGLHLVRIASLGELLAFLGVAASTVLKVPGLPPRTSLLVLDSISFCLPLSTTKDEQRRRTDAMLHMLCALTTLRDSRIPEHDRLSVIVTSQMATRVPAKGGTESTMVPALLNAATPAMRGTFDTSVYDWGTSILGRSAWRFLLSYHGVRSQRMLYIQSQPDAQFAEEPKLQHRCLSCLFSSHGALHETHDTLFLFQRVEC